jgi:hypothetical protein
VVNRLDALRQSGDRGVVGEIDDLGADTGLSRVGIGQSVLVAAGGDHLCSDVSGGEHNSASDSTAAADH